MLQKQVPIYPMKAELYAWVHLLEMPAQEDHRQGSKYEMPHAIHASPSCCKMKGNLSHCNLRM